MPVGPERLVAGPDVEVRADRIDVDGHVRDGLRAVDQRDGAGGADARGHLRDGDDRAEHVGDVRERHEPDVAPRELCVELLQRQFAALVDLQVAQRRAALAAQHLPGDDVGVVLELGDEDRVVRADVRPATLPRPQA